MTGMKLGVAVLGMVALAGVREAGESVGNLICHDPRALYIMAQYKMAVGDTKSALPLMRRAKTSRVTGSEKAKSSQAPVAKAVYIVSAGD